MDEEQEAADRQEALSCRYTDAARVVPLSSGRWAVFDGWGRGESCQIVDSIDQAAAALHSAIRAASFRSATAWKESLEATLRAQEERAAGEQKAGRGIEEMGL